MRLKGFGPMKKVTAIVLVVDALRILIARLEKFLGEIGIGMKEEHCSEN